MTWIPTDHAEHWLNDMDSSWPLPEWSLTPTWAPEHLNGWIPEEESLNSRSNALLVWVSAEYSLNAPGWPLFEWPEQWLTGLIFSWALASCTARIMPEWPRYMYVYGVSTAWTLYEPGTASSLERLKLVSGVNMSARINFAEIHFFENCKRKL